MAVKIGSLFGDVSLRTANLDKGIANVGKKLKKLGDNMQKMGKTLSVSVTAPIVAFGTLSVKAFAEQEKAEASLRAALIASGQAVDQFGNSNIARLQKMAAEIQKVTTVGDELALSFAQQGISMGLQVEQIEEATKGAIGLSKAFNLDMKMAMRAVSAAMQGQTELLTRYIPQLRGVEDQAERVAIVQQAMADGFKLAEAEADTTAGKIAQLKNAFGDFQEQIGAIIAEYLTPLIDRLKAIVTQLQNADPEMVKLGVQIAAISAALGPALLLLGKLVVVLTNVYVAGAAVAAGLAVLVAKMGILEEVGAALGQMLYDIWTGDVVAALGSFIAIIGEVVELFTGPFGLSFSADKVRSDFINLFQTAQRWANQFANTLRDVWNWLSRIAEKLPTAAAGRLIGDAISAVAFRADGGPVSAGSPYIVGEQGPELFVPRASGTIIPNGSAAAGGMNITMNFAPGLGMEFVSAVKNNQGLLAQIAVDAVREDNLRRV